MTMRIFYTIVILILCFACKNQTIPIFEAKNDTTEALKVALRIAFHRDSLRGILSINQGTTLEDTVIFKSDDFVMNYMPKKVDSIYFRFLDKDSICLLVKTWDYQTREPLPYLELSKFEKVDSAFDIFLKKVSLTPEYKEIEDHTQKGIVTFVESFRCISWDVNRAIYLRVSKQGETFKAKIMSGNSH